MSLMSSLKIKIAKFIKIDPRIMRKLRTPFAPFRRIGLKKEFSIFSNDCWGGRVYDKFHIKYTTPTIGLGVEPMDFVKFCSNYEHYINLDAKPIPGKQNRIDSEHGLYLCQLGDIVIHFVHYPNAEIAIQKWNSRKKRIIADNIIVKMNYKEEEPSAETLEKFLALPYKKILFVHKLDLYNEYCTRVRTVYIPEGNNDFLVADEQLSLKELKKIINE